MSKIVCWAPLLLPYTEAAEDRVEHLIGGRSAGNFSEVLRGEVKVRRDKLRWDPVLQPPLPYTPHVTGYVQPIPAERVDEYRRKGYRVDERVGMTGLEVWGEDYLTGQRGASLYVVDQEGGVVTRLGQTDAAPANEIYSTLDKDLQMQAQRAIQGSAPFPPLPAGSFAGSWAHRRRWFPSGRWWRCRSAGAGTWRPRTSSGRNGFACLGPG